MKGRVFSLYERNLLTLPTLSRANRKERFLFCLDLPRTYMQAEESNYPFRGHLCPNPAFWQLSTTYSRGPENTDDL